VLNFANQEQEMSLSKQSNCAVQLFSESEVNQSNKSTYCDYNEAFIGYDEIRQPHGLQCILNIFQKSEVPLEKQTVLEGGFGTGAYLDKIRHHVKKIYGVEGSDKGYQQTKKKVKNASNVNLRIGNILGLPFPEIFFHAYLVNQVIHHLDHSHHFQQLDVFLTESNRVLKPGGHLVINTCSQKQLDPETGSYWHYKYFPAAAQAIQKRYIPIKELEVRLASLGFTEIKRSIPAKKIFRQDYYEDPCIALQPEFRLGDSAYSFLSAAELDASNKRLLKAIDDGSVYRQMNLFAERAEEIGETVIISARGMS
jgi:ubiquinone/menaquinone biosynthesis C-methylase UbiE